MGKKKQTAADMEARSNYLEEKKQAELALKKREKRNAILIGICVVLVAALMIGVIVYKNLAESGYLLRREVAAQSENYEVDGAMMAYFFKEQYSSYSSYASYFGIDANKSLKSQTSAFGGTWFDYFMSLTKNYVTEVLALCEAAKAAGVELNDEDMKSIDDTIAEMELYATMYGYTPEQYMTLIFGAGIKEKDVRNAMELTALATKYAGEFNESLEYTLEDCEAYYAENVDAFDTVDLLKFTVSRADFVVKDAEGNVTGDLELARQAAEDYARKLGAAADEETFKTLAKDYIMTIQGKDEAAAEEQLAKLLNEDVLKTSTAHKEAVLEWAFSAEAGAVNLFSESDANDEVTVYNVYYLVTAAGRDETATRNIRHILFLAENYASEEEAKADAEAIYAEWEAAGFTEEKFLELNEKHNDDPGSVENGGLYENVAPGAMVAEFDEWLFAEERAEGDHGLVETADYGWHIMSYAGESDVAVWQTAAESALSNDAYQALLDEYKTSVEFDNAALGHIAA